MSDGIEIRCGACRKPLDLRKTCMFKPARNGRPMQYYHAHDCMEYKVIEVRGKPDEHKG